MDRTYGTCVIVECPEDGRADAARILSEYGFDVGDELDFDVAYGGVEIPVGTASDVASSLREAVPGSSFWVQEDPAYEFMGEVWMYTPELGMYGGVCDSNGHVVLRATTVENLLGRADIEDALFTLTGKAWREALNYK